MGKQVIVYMSPWCYTSQDTQNALKEWGVPATFINIKEDKDAAARVRGWVGFESVPTVILAEADSLLPYEPPASLASGASPRGIDRGSMITEASRVQLKAWLTRHGVLAG